ncbi:hypothetical protein [Niveispirillum sp.]|uniref:hypothetical protein n=1 Tax=Niveispirillum sp. TaxID=1917217 RepID=UPI001B56C6A7|nr:hypothetical protein [Niveispirillum sp.]MBP7336467.1 hypothetical protein [Niveispirillum sp.]
MQIMRLKQRVRFLALTMVLCPLPGCAIIDVTTTVVGTAADVATTAVSTTVDVVTAPLP